MLDLKSHARAALLAALALALGAYAAQPPREVHDGLVYDGVPATDAALVARLSRYLQSHAARFLDWLPDGSLLVALPQDTDGEQLYRVAGPLREPELLGAPRGAPIEAAGKAFDASGIVYTRRAADGGTHLYALDLGAHVERELSVGGRSPAGPLWAHDGRRLVYRAADATAGNGAQLYALDTASGESHRLSSGDDWRALDWSMDDHGLLVLHQAGDAPAELLRLDTATLQATPIVLRTDTVPVRRGRRGAPPPPPPAAWIRHARFSSDGRSVLVLAAAPGQAARLWRQSIDGSEPAVALSPYMAHDVEHFDQSADGHFVAYSYDDSGYSRLIVLDLRAGSERVVFALPTGTVNALKFDRAGSRLAVNVEGPSLPAEVHVLDLASNALVRWTQATLGPLERNELSVPAVVRVPAWRSNSALLPPALVYRPAGADGKLQPLPVLIALPDTGGAPRARFDADLQALVNAVGCALIVPTLRGEAGTPEGRDQITRDVAALLVWIGHQDEFDRERIAIEGTAASAPVALATLALFGDRLRGGIVTDNASVNVPAQVIERPVLLLRGASGSPAPFGVVEQLMWRLRVAGNETWVLATNLDQAESMNRAQALEAVRVRVQFLRRVFAAAGNPRGRSG